MKKWWLLALGVIFGLLGAGGIVLASSPPRGTPIQLLPAPTPIPIKIYVSGEVTNPGVFQLPKDSRVQDAIETAGGFTEKANARSLNLAARLEDGDQVSVPAILPTATLPAKTDEGAQQNNPSEQQPIEPSSVLININTATQSELETLPGIGPVTAQKIIEYRETNGLFTGIEDIQKVSGIGPATFEKIKGFITVSEK